MRRRHPFLKALFFLLILCLSCLGGLWVLERLNMIEKFGDTGGERVAIIEVEGVITASREVVEKIQQYAESESIKAIVLRVDSPGGGVGPAQEIYRELMKIRDKKTLVTSMGSVAASGGYYVACATHTIFANPGTITGSIGVIIEFANMEELLDKIGLKAVVIKSGRYKDILSPTRELEQDEQALIQGVVDSIHGQFIDAVAEGRSLERETVAGIADGRIFSGQQARELGLVDELGNLDDAVRAAAKLAGIEGEPDVLYPEKKRPSIWEFFLQETRAALRGGIHATGIEALFLME